MGKTNSPLTIWVSRRWADHPKMTALAKMGHVIVPMDTEFPDVPEPDLILHPQAWRWGDQMWEYLDRAVKESRKIKRASKSSD